MRVLSACCPFINKQRNAQVSSAVTPTRTVRTVRLEVVPDLLPSLPRSRAEIQRLLDEGLISLDCAEGAMGMDGACDGFPQPSVM
jgi:hypothetical protein